MKSLGKKLVKVMEACRYIARDSQNAYQNYKYTSAASMFGRINEALTANGICVSSTMRKIETREVANSKGTLEKYVEVEVALTFRDVDSDEYLTNVAIGSGQDLGDKAVMKAQTAALKYAYIGGLCIAMGDDPNESNQQMPANTPARMQQMPAQINQNVFKCSDCGVEINQKVANYSQNKFGRMLCYNCQHKPIEPEDIPFD